MVNTVLLKTSNLLVARKNQISLEKYKLHFLLLRLNNIYKKGPKFRTTPKKNFACLPSTQSYHPDSLT